ncbi:hypothetical protein KCU92_g342, partial [Aureobasidium melanogenum]
MKSCTVGVSPWQLLILFQPKTVSESWPRPRTRTWRKSRRTRSVKTSYDMSFTEKRLSTIFFSIDELRSVQGQKVMSLQTSDYTIVIPVISGYHS